jgi:predicted metal-dependent phosphoesterase TrpH
MPATQYDLHSHSIASDGTLTALQLVRRAREKGVDVLALTDHDTTAGLDEARIEAARCGLSLVNGVEISVTWGHDTIHLVGLNIDPAAPELGEGLKSLRKFRRWRAEEIGRRLARRGVPGACEGAGQLAGGQIVSRTHFARFLLAEGYARSLQDAFRRFLVRGKPGHVPGQWADLEAAVSWVRSAGGQAVVAHPARYRMTNTKLKVLLGEFRDCGGLGIEVVSGSHSADDCRYMARLANAFGLRASRGSDYHGPENAWVELGRMAELPADVVPIWSGWTDQLAAAKSGGSDGCWQ